MSGLLSKNMGLPYMSIRKDPVTGKYTSVYVDPKEASRAAPPPRAAAPPPRAAPPPYWEVPRGPPPPSPGAAPAYKTYSSWSAANDPFSFRGMPGGPAAAAPPRAAPPRAASPRRAAPPPPPPRAAPRGGPSYAAPGAPPRAAPSGGPRGGPRAKTEEEIEAEHAARERVRFEAEINKAPESAETDIAKRIVLTMTDAQIKERYGATIADAKKFFKRFVLNIAPDKIGEDAGPLYRALLEKLKAVYGGPILGNGRPKKCKKCGGAKY